MQYACTTCGAISPTRRCAQHGGNPTPAQPRTRGRRGQALRAATIATHGRTCHICGQPIEQGERWHLDHLTPLSQGGTDHPDNLRPAHASCNLAKGPHEPRQWAG